MVQENELLMLIFGLCIFGLILSSYAKIKNIRSIKFLIAGFCVFLTGWTFTVLESFIWERALNILEHGSYALGSILVALWCWGIAGQRNDNS